MELKVQEEMKIGIMQPYLFPYIGYYQLMYVSDIFVLHDDVQYIKGGWINRNRLLLDGKPHLFTFSVEKADFYLNINRRIFTDSLYKDKLTLTRFLHTNYRKAPFFEPTMKLVEEILSCQSRRVSQFIRESLLTMASYLDIKCCILESSSLVMKDNSLSGQDRVINIVQTLKGDHYINPIGGVNLYNKEDFSKLNIKLNFINTDFYKIGYQQFDKELVQGLSIIDVLMFNSVEEVKRMLGCFNLI